MSQSESTVPLANARPLTNVGRYLILVCAFLGWLCAGFHLAITSLAMQPAAISLLSRTGQLDAVRFKTLNQQAPKKGAPATSTTFSAEDAKQLTAWKSLVTSWFSWYQCAFLFGAASGGLLFGRLGDRLGRARAMALSILTYSIMSAAAATADGPWQLLILWYLACTGVGGMWPNGVALVSEVWSSVSRPVVAGVIGTSANIGIYLFANLASIVSITPGGWRWALWVGATPVVLGLVSWFFVPESPRWLATRNDLQPDSKPETSTWDVFRGALCPITIVGIMLATIPMIGAWGSANWMVPWADDAGNAATPPDPYLKAEVQKARSLTGIVGSLLGGWIGSLLGRRLTYFLVSFAALGIAQYTFWRVVPTDPDFLFWVGALGFFSGIYFGWLPLFLPELFPTKVRSTGAGVSFNFGRILTAFTVFTTGILVQEFASNYAQIGRITSLVFVLGMIMIYLAPDTKDKQLAD